MTSHIRTTLENLGKGAVELRVDPDLFAVDQVAKAAVLHGLTTHGNCSVALTGTESWDTLRSFTQALLYARIQHT